MSAIRQTPEDVARFLAKASDDACCRWLCETAGRRTRAQELGIGQAVKELDPAQGRANIHALESARRMIHARVS